MKAKNPIRVVLPLLIGLVVVAQAAAGSYRSITIDGGMADWDGIAPAYVNENGLNNPVGVDFQNVYLANDDNFLYIRFTLQHAADPISPWNTYIWIDNDNDAATGFHPFGNLNFGSSLMLIHENAFQQAEGGWNEGDLLSASGAYGANSIPGTDFEFRISRAVTGVSGAFTGAPLLDSPAIKLQLASETGTGDSLPAWDNYGALSYTFAVVPEPSVLGLGGMGLLLLAGRSMKKRSES